MEISIFFSIVFITQKQILLLAQKWHSFLKHVGLVYD